MDISKWFRTSSSSSSIPSSSTSSGDQRLLQEEHDRLFGSRYPRRNMQNKNDRKEDEGEEDVAKEEDKDEPPVEEVEEDLPEQKEETGPQDEAKEEDQETPEERVQTEQPTTEEVVDTEETGDGSLVGETRIDLVKLVPFDVKLSLTVGNDVLNNFALADIVSDWMDESLAAQVQLMELDFTHSTFDSVILEERGISLASTTPTTTTSSLKSHDFRRNLRPSNRDLQQTTPTTIASYEGVTLWKYTTNSNQQIMTPALLEDIERQALLQDDRLLEMLKGSPAEGLGDRVQDVRAYINPNPPTYVAVPPTNTENSNADHLELIIVVAIVVACMAFAFLVFSLFCAWRYDQQRRGDAYRVDATPPPPKNTTTKARNPDGSGKTNETEDDSRSPTNMDVVVKTRQDDDDTALDYPTSETNPTTGLYPESVISEDISTSLSAYYRSGMGSRPLYGSKALGSQAFDDQASFSSMESYGYSLDGYAPSLGGNTTSNNNGPAKPPSDAGNEDEERPNP